MQNNLDTYWVDLRDCYVPCLKKHPDAQLPKFAFKDDGCADLYSVEDIILKSHSTAIVDIGLAMAIPEGWELQIRSRSGLAAKNGVFVLNSPGTIDAQYRNSIKIILGNLSDEDFEIQKGMRIAQGALRPVPTVHFLLVNELPPSSRGMGGLGSTGLK